MSRDWITCAICERDFVYDHDREPSDVCHYCTNRIGVIVSRALSTERTRLRALLLATAAKFGGPVQAALVELGEGIKEDNHG